LEHDGRGFREVEESEMRDREMARLRGGVYCRGRRFVGFVLRLLEWMRRSACRTRGLRC